MPAIGSASSCAETILGAISPARVGYQPQVGSTGLLPPLAKSTSWDSNLPRGSRSTINLLSSSQTEGGGMEEIIDAGASA